jgi:hypothetical protein
MWRRHSNYDWWRCFGVHAAGNRLQRAHRRMRVLDFGPALHRRGRLEENLFRCMSPCPCPTANIRHGWPTPELQAWAGTGQPPLQIGKLLVHQKRTGSLAGSLTVNRLDSIPWTLLQGCRCGLELWSLLSADRAFIGAVVGVPLLACRTMGCMETHRGQSSCWRRTLCERRLLQPSVSAAAQGGLGR